jgi:hypothetical protein
MGFFNFSIFDFENKNKNKIKKNEKNLWLWDLPHFLIHVGRRGSK